MDRDTNGPDGHIGLVFCVMLTRCTESNGSPNRQQAGTRQVLLTLACEGYAFPQVRFKNFPGVLLPRAREGAWSAPGWVGRGVV